MENHWETNLLQSLRYIFDFLEVISHYCISECIFTLCFLQHLKGMLKNTGPRMLTPVKPLAEAPVVNISNLKLAKPPAYTVSY